MTPRARAMVLAVLLATGAASCGQQGPLVLPEDARPIEPIEPVEPTGSETEQSTDEEQDER
jgi:predicted small lipoprotein YifL